MKTVYTVRSIPVRNAKGATVGWVRADMFPDGTDPADMVLLRDGSAFGQAEAAKRIAVDPALLYPTRAEAMHDGLAIRRCAQPGRGLHRMNDTMGSGACSLRGVHGERNYRNFWRTYSRSSRCPSAWASRTCSRT